MPNGIVKKKPFLFYRIIKQLRHDVPHSYIMSYNSTDQRARIKPLPCIPHLATAELASLGTGPLASAASYQFYHGDPRQDEEATGIQNGISPSRRGRPVCSP